jgi:hypothetical protein
MKHTAHKRIWKYVYCNSVVYIYVCDTYSTAQTSEIIDVTQLQIFLHANTAPVLYT